MDRSSQLLPLSQNPYPSDHRVLVSLQRRKPVEAKRSQRRSGCGHFFLCNHGVLNLRLSSHLLSS